MENYDDEFYSGVIAALISPLFMSIGFIFWDQAWSGSAIMLNLFKCSVASLMFFIVITLFPQEAQGLDNFSCDSPTLREAQLTPDFDADKAGGSIRS